MDKGVIEENLLQKDIEHIDLYGNQEIENLESLCQEFEDSLEDYKSDMNTNLMLAEITKFENKIDDIEAKRKQYTVILNKVIEQYHHLTNKTVNRFSGDNL